MGHGNPKLKDMQSEFYQAIRHLRNTAGFIECSSSDDTTAHFVLGKLTSFPIFQVQMGGQNNLYACTRTLFYYGNHREQFHNT